MFFCRILRIFFAESPFPNGLVFDGKVGLSENRCIDLSIFLDEVPTSSDIPALTASGLSVLIRTTKVFFLNFWRSGFFLNST